MTLDVYADQFDDLDAQAQALNNARFNAKLERGPHPGVSPPSRPLVDPLAEQVVARSAIRD
jgi:hypothetical protein